MQKGKMLHKPLRATQKLATISTTKLDLKDKQHLREANRSGGGIYFKWEEPTGAKAVRYTRANQGFSIRGDLTPQGEFGKACRHFCGHKLKGDATGLSLFRVQVRGAATFPIIQYTGQPPRFNAFKVSKAPMCETQQDSREGRFKMRLEEQAVTRS